MRYMVGFLLALALTTSPLNANAQAGDKGESAAPMKLALMPEHLQKRMPGYRHDARAPQETFEIKYVAPPPTPESRKRKKRMAIGLGVTAAVVLGLAIGAGVVAYNFME